MILNKENKGSYSEEFDIARLQQIADMAYSYVRSGERAVDIPDWHFSDLECNVWSIMTNLVRKGKELA